MTADNVASADAALFCCSSLYRSLSFLALSIGLAPVQGPQQIRMPLHLQAIATMLADTLAGVAWVCGKAADLVVALLPAFLPKPNLGFVHHHGVKHVTLLFGHCLHLSLQRGPPCVRVCVCVCVCVCE